jgi:hypothetical protein
MFVEAPIAHRQSQPTAQRHQSHPTDATQLFIVVAIIEAQTFAQCHQERQIH